MTEVQVTRYKAADGTLHKTPIEAARHDRCEAFGAFRRAYENSGPIQDARKADEILDSLYEHLRKIRGANNRVKAAGG